MSDATHRRRSPWWIRLLIFGLLLCVLAPMGVFHVLCNEAIAPSAGLAEQGPQVGFFVPFLLAAVCFVMSVAAYALVWRTRCFTADVSQPCFEVYRSRSLWGLVVIMLGPMGTAIFIILPFAMPWLRERGVSEHVAFAGILLSVGVMVFGAAAMFNVFAPVERKLIIDRQRAKGLSEEFIKTGVLMGISDPTRSSVNKTLVEDDIGLMWISPDRLCYRGDVQNLDIRPSQVVGVERKADPWSMSSVGGVVHVILRFRRDDGVERLVRFHPVGGLTIRGAANASDKLAAQLSDWHRAGVTALPKATVADARGAIDDVDPPTESPA